MIKKTAQLARDGFPYRLYCRDKLGKRSFSNLWTSWRPKIPIGKAVLTVLWKTTPNKYQLPSHLSLFNAIYRGEPSLPTSVLAFCLDASYLSQRRHKSWNFNFAEISPRSKSKRWAILGKKVGAFSCSDWGRALVNIWAICGIIRWLSEEHKSLIISEHLGDFERSFWIHVKKRPLWFGYITQCKSKEKKARLDHHHILTFRCWPPQNWEAAPEVVFYIRMISSVRRNLKRSVAL